MNSGPPSVSTPLGFMESCVKESMRCFSLSMCMFFAEGFSWGLGKQPRSPPKKLVHKRERRPLEIRGEESGSHINRLYWRHRQNRRTLLHVIEEKLLMAWINLNKGYLWEWNSLPNTSVSHLDAIEIMQLAEYSIQGFFLLILNNSYIHRWVDQAKQWATFRWLKS